MKFTSFLAVSASLGVSTLATAESFIAPSGPVQFVPQSQAVVQTQAHALDISVLKAGTLVPLKMREGLTTKGKVTKVGQRFNLEVAEAVELNGRVVIPAGAYAVGEVTSVRNKGMWGKSGNIEGRVLYVRVNDRQIRLSGTMNDKGTTGTAGVVGAVAVLPLAGFFMTGTSADIPIGTPVRGFTDEDVPVAFEGVAPAPMIVPSASPTDIPASAVTPQASPAASAPTDALAKAANPKA